MAKKKQKKKGAKKTVSKAKAVSRASQSDEPFYIGVHNPKDLRRNVLETSKDVISILKQYEYIKQVRKEKRELMEDLDGVMKEIRTSMNKLKKTLPKTQLRQSVDQGMPFEQAARIEQEQIVAESVAQESQKKPLSELDKLEAELHSIEHKLQKV
ncbi:MAG: hypothetical protein ACOCWQ_00225 [Nanoarchaeota archaeon]